MTAAGAALAWRCAACGTPADPNALAPFRCPQAGTDDRDHVLERTIDPAALRFAVGRDANPFLRHRQLLTAWHTLRAAGSDDAEYVDLVTALDARIAAVDGRGFAVTPFGRDASLSERLGFTAEGGVWVKDETRNVGGSHKARHLMAVILQLAALDRLGRLPGGTRGTALAIASCGNAALAGAVLARAAGHRLLVFVPAEADPGVLARLRQLEADVRICPTAPGDGARGDPCVLAFREAVGRGAVPFSCQGTECALAIEGGETLVWEMLGPLAESGVRLDRLFVQVGGGALASACVHAFTEAAALGIPAALPRLHPVQTSAVAPLARAYERVRARAQSEGTGTAEALREARDHRSRVMWPWEGPASSAATGILDVETYDWHAVLTGTIAGGGFPVTVSEATLAEARALAHEVARVRANTTGAAGLAGLVALRRAGMVRADERVAVLLTGVERS